MRTEAFGSRAGLAAVALVTVTSLVAGCTDAKLYGVDSQPNFADRISLQGDVCTDDPAAVAFPVKVLVVMDGTGALAAADPTANRAAALRSFIGRYPGANYHFGLVQYGSLARLLTDGYAADLTELQPALDAISIGTGEAQRNWMDALRAATTTVQDDILSSTPGARSRTRYVVLFVTAGPPTPALGAAWCMSRGLDPASAGCKSAFTTEYCGEIAPAPDDCEAAVYERATAELRQYAFDHGVADLVFDTFALTTDARANDLATQMAYASRGAFEQQKPDALNLLRTDISAQSSALLQRALIVYNPYMVLRAGRPVPDSDADGLTDDEERVLGTDPARADTDGDYVGDGIEVRLAAPGLLFDPKTPHVPDGCLLLAPPDRDSDGDGLTDCEESVLRTDPSLVDTDKDGLPDTVEVRRGSNPLVDDLLEDADRDGLPNGEEVRAGLGAIAGDAEWELTYGYRYRVIDEGVQTRLEAIPHDPLPGVLVVGVDGSTPLVGRIEYAPGTSAAQAPTLAWTDDVQRGTAGPAVDVSQGGTFDLVGGANGRKLTVRVTPAALPPTSLGPQHYDVLVRPTTRDCFHFDVRNIALVETLEREGGRPGRGWDTLQVWLGQVPQASPTGYLVFDLATVPMRFLAPDRKSPNRPFITLDQDSFVLLEGAP